MPAKQMNRISGALDTQACKTRLFLLPALFLFRCELTDARISCFFLLQNSSQHRTLHHFFLLIFSSFFLIVKNSEIPRNMMQCSPLHKTASHCPAREGGSVRKQPPSPLRANGRGRCRRSRGISPPPSFTAASPSAPRRRRRGTHPFHPLPPPPDAPGSPDPRAPRGTGVFRRMVF